jgi:hypothetical protein
MKNMKSRHVQRGGFLFCFSLLGLFEVNFFLEVFHVGIIV